MPGVTVTATNLATNQAEVGRHRRVRLLHVPEPAARSLHGQRRAPGLQEGDAHRTCNSTPPARSPSDLALETGALTEEVTVTAEAAPLQTDVAMRKTVEAKDIEQLSFSGRNPIGVAGLKAGVSGRRLQ